MYREVRTNLQRCFGMDAQSGIIIKDDESRVGSFVLYNKTFMNNKLIKTIGTNYDTHYMNEG